MKVLTGSSKEARMIAEAFGLDVTNLTAMQFNMTVGEPAVLMAIYRVPIKVAQAEKMAEALHLCKFELKLLEQI
jgi:hypothetical protein